MSQIILINKIKVQNANAVAGFTWGFPAITHFLGFTQNLSLKLSRTAFQGISISGCSVISHEHNAHTYGGYESKFTQTKNPGAMSFERDKAGKIVKGPSIIEEGKMNMLVSLLMRVDGFIGKPDDFASWLKKQCYMQRLAGGTILEIEAIQIFDLGDKNKFYSLKHKLLPGFILMDRSEFLADYHDQERNKNPNAVLVESWLDFAALKQKARPKSNLITQHLQSQLKHNYIDESLVDDWKSHIEKVPFDGSISQTITHYFESIEADESNKKLLEQWQNYIHPTNKSLADWEYLPKPNMGFLVPIMTGYKAISEVFKNEDIANTRDSETPVCFVEAVHSIGEWLGVNKLKNSEDLADCLWDYDYEEHWYLCKQRTNQAYQTANHENTNTDYSDLS